MRQSAGVAATGEGEASFLGMTAADASAGTASATGAGAGCGGGGGALTGASAGGLGGDGAAALEGRVRLMNADGFDCTPAMREGVRRALAFTEAAGARRALLKSRSPSCGKRRVHTRDGLIAGQGMFAAALSARGIPIDSEED